MVLKCVHLEPNLAGCLREASGLIFEADFEAAIVRRSLKEYLVNAYPDLAVKWKITL